MASITFKIPNCLQKYIYLSHERIQGIDQYRLRAYMCKERYVDASWKSANFYTKEEFAIHESWMSIVLNWKLCFDPYVTKQRKLNMFIVDSSANKYINHKYQI